RLPSGKDPADLLVQEGVSFLKQEILEKTVSLLDYRLYSIKKNFDLQKDEERLAYWQKARILLAGSDEVVEREAQLKKIAGEIGISLEVLRGDLEKIIQGYPLKEGRATPKKKEKEKLSPHALLEKELLACLLQYPQYAPDVWREIKPEDFICVPFREIA